MASQPTVSLPKLVKPDDVIRASDFNKLRNAVMALARGGVAAIPISQSPDTKPNLWVSEPFKATDGTSNVVSVTAGYLTYQLLLKKDDTGGPLYYDTPTINDVSIESPDKENITISGAGFIYMHCTTNNRGVPTMTPTIDFYATEQASVHHVPESEDYNTPAVDGDYYWQLAEIEAVPDSSPTIYRIKRRIPGDKFIPNQIDRIKNIGDGVKLYWGFDPSATNALHKLRTLANATESGAAPLIKALASEADETVKIKALIAGTGITLSSSPDAVEISRDSPYGEGDDFNLENYACDMTTPPTSPLWTIYFRSGIAYLADPGGAPTSTLVMYDGFSCSTPAGP